MKSEHLCQIVSDLMDEINVSRESQISVDNMYNCLIHVIHDEMQDKLVPLSIGGKQRTLRISHTGIMNYQIYGRLHMIKNYYIHVLRVEGPPRNLYSAILLLLETDLIGCLKRINVTIGGGS